MLFGHMDKNNITRSSEWKRGGSNLDDNPQPSGPQYFAGESLLLISFWWKATFLVGCFVICACAEEDINSKKQSQVPVQFLDRILAFVHVLKSTKEKFRWLRVKSLACSILAFLGSRSQSPLEFGLVIANCVHNACKRFRTPSSSR